MCFIRGVAGNAVGTVWAGCEAIVDEPGRYLIAGTRGEREYDQCRQPFHQGFSLSKALRVNESRVIDWIEMPIQILSDRGHGGHGPADKARR